MKRIQKSTNQPAPSYQDLEGKQNVKPNMAARNKNSEIHQELADDFGDVLGDGFHGLDDDYYYDEDDSFQSENLITKLHNAAFFMRLIEIYSGTQWECDLLQSILKNNDIESFIRNNVLNSYALEPIQSDAVKPGFIRLFELKK